MADEGMGFSIIFESGYVAEATSFDLSGEERPAHDITATNTPLVGGHARRIKLPSKLIEPGTLEVTFWHDPDVPAPIRSAPVTLQVRYPVPPGMSNPAIREQVGFLTSHSHSVQIDDVMQSTATIQLTGEPSFTQAS